MTKPASRVIAKAMPKGDGYVGQFALPGLIPDLVRDKNGEPTIFRTEIDAHNAACRVLVAVLQARTEDTRKAGGITRLTPAEFGELLAKADITPTYFAELMNLPYHRVMKWLDGEQDIIHAANLLVRLMADENNFRLIEAITKQAQDD